MGSPSEPRDVEVDAVLDVQNLLFFHINMEVERVTDMGEDVGDSTLVSLISGHDLDFSKTPSDTLKAR